MRPTTIAVVAVLLAFPLGFFLKARLTACVVYAIAYLWSFTFQTLYLLLAREGGDYSAFSEDPVFPLSYGSSRPESSRSVSGSCGSGTGSAPSA